MTHLSKRILKPEVKNDMLSALDFLIKDLNNIPDTQKFLTSVLSGTERMMIAKRIVAAFLLKNNVDQAEIGDLLKLTPGTIARLKLWVQTHKEGFDVIFEKLDRQRKSGVAKEMLYRILHYAIRAGSGRVPNIFPNPYQEKQSALR